MSDQAKWLEMNDGHLSATLAWVRMRLRRLAALHAETEKHDAIDAESGSGAGWFRKGKKNTQKQLPAPVSIVSDDALNGAFEKMKGFEKHDPPPALILLGRNLGLSRFDQSVLALCAAVELDMAVGQLCARALNDPSRPYPTFGLAFALFDEPNWNALSPNAPLRYWRLLEINQAANQPLTAASLGVDERIVNYLKGLNYLDDRLAPLVDPLNPELSGEQLADSPLPGSQQQVVDRIVSHVNRQNETTPPPVIELTGSDSASKRLIARKVAAELGLAIQSISHKNIPAQIADFETFSRLWQRESMLMPLALFIDAGDDAPGEQMQMRRFVERNTGIVFIDVVEGGPDTSRERVSLEVNKPTPEEQQSLWQALLGDNPEYQSQRLAQQFSFNQGEIRRLSKATDAADAPLSREEFWQQCRVAARVGMEALARRIDAKAKWDQLILPNEQKSLLQQLTDQVSCRNRVYEDWGFRQQMNRGLGINALFAGESGTGKTMAAEVIANALELDLYRIDLSSVVSKYIGETEKNLRKLFDAAEDSGAILFFDEADALFGKRSEVKDSHDRYANIEINYLLQRMESYRGLAILATNLKNALDKAFVRRLRFIVDFPFPELEQRAEIWSKVFPPDTPLTGDIDYQRLAKLGLTGGNIHNIALNAAFLAAERGEQVSMPLILKAARNEFKKLERPTKDSDFVWKSNLEAVS